jgi:hypothetical protein
VEYLRDEQISVVDGASTETPSVVEGKTYIVDISSGSPVVVDEHGQDIPENERKEVLTGVTGASDKKSGTRKKQPVLPDRAIRLGEQFKLTPAQVATLVDDMADAVQRVEIRLDRIEAIEGQRCGVFTVDATVKMAERGVEITADLQGTATITAEGTQVLTTRLSGPVSAEMTMGTLSGRLQGRMEVAADVTYTPTPR